MATAIDLADLRALMGLGADPNPPDTQLTPATEAAVLLVDEELIHCGYSDARLAKIAIYLAAHFVQGASGGRVASESTGRSSVSYFAGITDLYLDSSSYGQTAKTLDTKGCLSRIGKRPVIFRAMPVPT